MHLIIIGARNTGTSLYLVSLAIQRGYSVTILTAGHDDLINKFDECVRVQSLTITTNNVISWIEKEIKYKTGTLLITTAHDLYAAVASRVAKYFNVPGPDSRAVSFCVSKQNQSELLKKMGYRSEETTCISLAEFDAEEMTGRQTYPVVIKPVEGSASDGIALCHSAAEAITHIQSLADTYNNNPNLIPEGKIIIEKYISGQEYCVELFDGVFVGAMRKNKLAGSRFIERGYSSDIDLSAEQTDRLVTMVENIANSFNLLWGPVHIDCIIGKNHIHIIEINPRIAGSFITSIVRDAWGFDISDALLDRLEGKKNVIRRKIRPEKFAQAVFFLEGDPETWTIPVSGKLSDHSINLIYAPQYIPERERRAYIYMVV